MFEIAKKYRDMSGAWIAQVIISENESIHLKFDHDPAQVEVDVEAEIFVANRRIAELRNQPVVEDAAPDIAIVSPRQFRRALIQVGMMDAVEAFMAQAPIEIKTDWEYSTEVRRDYPGWDQFAAAVGKTPADVDAVFALASTVV